VPPTGRSANSSIGGFADVWVRRVKGQALKGLLVNSLMSQDQQVA
jgi:hypothetical protein